MRPKTSRPRRRRRCAAGADLLRRGQGGLDRRARGGGEAAGRRQGGRDRGARDRLAGQPGALRARRAAARRSRQRRREAAPPDAKRSASWPWRIVEPFAKPRRRRRRHSPAGELAGLEAARELEGAARGDVGLEPPRGSVSWKTATAEGRLEIGGAVPATHDVVVAASGRRAPAVTGRHACSPTLAARPAIGGAARSWRRPATASSGCDLAAPRQAAVVLARSGETLRLESPVADLVDRDLADRLLADLAAPAHGDVSRPAACRRRSKRRSPSAAGAFDLTIAGELGAVADRGRRRATLRQARLARRRSGLRERLGARRDRRRAAGWRLAQPQLDALRELAHREGASRGGRRRLRARARATASGCGTARRSRSPAASDLLAALTAAKAERLVECAGSASLRRPRRRSRSLSPTPTATRSVLTLLAGDRSRRSGGSGARPRGREPDAPAAARPGRPDRGEDRRRARGRAGGGASRRRQKPAEAGPAKSPGRTIRRQTEFSA